LPLANCGRTRRAGLRGLLKLKREIGNKLAIFSNDQNPFGEEQKVAKVKNEKATF
jgi:hypothetical protein